MNAGHISWASFALAIFGAVDQAGGFGVLQSLGPWGAVGAAAIGGAASYIAHVNNPPASAAPPTQGALPQ